MYQPKTRTEDRLPFEKDRRQSEDSVFETPNTVFTNLDISDHRRNSDNSYKNGSPRVNDRFSCYACHIVLERS